MSESDTSLDVGPDALAVRAAMGDRCGHGPDDWGKCARLATAAQEADYTAHRRYSCLPLIHWQARRRRRLWAKAGASKLCSRRGWNQAAVHNGPLSPLPQASRCVGE